MWISENIKFGGGSAPVRAETGRVSIAGAEAAVVTDGEKRSLLTALPPGIRSSAKLGQRVLLITTDSGEAVVAGVTDGTAPESLAIEAGGCLIELDGGEVKISAGRIELSGGTVGIDGALYINGEKYEPPEGAV